MGIFTYWQGSIYMMMQLLMMNLVVWLGWFSAIALARVELSETVTGTVNLTNVGIACLGNLDLFFTSLVKGRLYLEIAARDAPAIITGPKLEDINEFGLTTIHGGKRKYRDASVVMLSNHTSNSSIREFMKYICNAHDVYSILLDCPLKSAPFAPVTGEICKCNCESLSGNAEIIAECRCIVFQTVEGITSMLDGRMPETLKPLSDSLCLLPSLPCQKTGCHGCNQNVLGERTENEPRMPLPEGDSMVKSPVGIYEALDFKFASPIQEKLLYTSPPCGRLSAMHIFHGFQDSMTIIRKSMKP